MTTNTINVPHVQQVESHFCWAACMQMFISHYRHFGDAGVPSQQDLDRENSEANFCELNSPVDYAGIVKALKKRGREVTDFARALSWEEITTAILKSRLVIACGAKHSKLIIGTGTKWSGTKFLRINDLGKMYDSFVDKDYDLFVRSEWEQTITLKAGSAHALE